MRYRVFVFPALSGADALRLEGYVLVVSAPDVVTAAAQAVACCGGGPVEAVNVVEEDNGPADEGTVFFACQMFPDGRFVYAEPLIMSAPVGDQGR